MQYPKELYNPTHYRVVFSDEEMKKALSEGWQEAKPEGHPYVPISAAGPVAKAAAEAPWLTRKDFEKAFAPPVEEVKPEPEKRGPGRPPNKPKEL